MSYEGQGDFKTKETKESKVTKEPMCNKVKTEGGQTAQNQSILCTFSIYDILLIILFRLINRKNSKILKSI